MGKTIIQTIGPLYGEVVNGTVFGRPNGSVYVPATNTIQLTLPDNDNNIIISNSRFLLCASDGTISSKGLEIVAESQDIQNYVQYFIAENADGSSMLGKARILASGQFNVKLANASHTSPATDGATITDGTTYYYVAQLVSNSGVPVATSIVPVTGVVPE